MSKNNTTNTALLLSLLSLGVLSPLVSYAQALHLPTSKDAFMHVQYNTASELADALSKDAHARKAIAKHFKISEAALVEYVRENLILTTTTQTISVPNYGLTSKNYMYYKMSTFKPGLKIWATRDGKPVLKWVCTNPIAFTLPAPPPKPVAKAAPKPVEKPKPVVIEKPIVVEKPKPVVIEKPVVPPPVVEKPKPIVIEKPIVVEKPKPVVPRVTPPTPPVPQPTPPVVTPLLDPCALMSIGSKTRFNVMYGRLGFNQPAFDKLTAKNQTGFLGASFDILRSPRTATSLYMNYSRNTHSAVCAEALGYGLERRVYLHCVDRVSRPYYGAGVGSYKTLFLTNPGISIGRPTNLGGKVFLGIENRSHTFIEVGHQALGSFQTLGKTGKVNLNNTYVGAGLRF